MITSSEISPLIDEIALKLLEELQKNARLSYADLGRTAGYPLRPPPSVCAGSKMRASSADIAPRWIPPAWV